MENNVTVPMTVEKYVGIPLNSYNMLTQKPQINSVELQGNRSLDELDIAAKSDFVAEVARATAAETANATAIAKEATRAKETESGKAPTAHAVNDGTYGVGTSTLYGHVRLSDNINSTSDANNSIAATPAAVKAVMDTVSADNAGAHNAIYRGKYLGDVVTAEQYAAIAAGTFAGLYIGDYWTIGGVNWRIAAFDYYYNCGDTNCSTHHAVIVPDTCLYNSVMNDTSITTGGYVGSKMYTEGLEPAKTTINTIFNGHVLTHRIYLVNAVANGRGSEGVWCDSSVDLMNEQMVYGSGIFSPVSDGSSVPKNYRVEKSQLPLFQHEPSRFCNRNNWWLRDVITAAYFAHVYDSGLAGCTGASLSLGVRPAFCICG